ncbi:DUF3080 domain-containing protein [Marinobacter halophilus]|uniref:DUF3080 domain-containing protein n=1 Tax=Marinobacter halophilus TaxID=1323740 RepID=A0A2T1KIG5_9GAMM|nr:DUF3080 domain-containing protein [Marinobacter halophilus]PSF09798.1 DUF3080 domain-containing protein [Marinobacter halophilus]GGC79946.1 hypothetical protein GCM10011362_30690 [Marinobacter halophilus]
MPGTTMLQWLVPGFCALMLSGCNPFSEAEPMMDEYLERLGRVLDTPPVAILTDLPDASIIPRRRERVLEMPDLELGMLDFMSLYGCELQYVVGERNSVMGQVMQPLNRLRYEVRFIRAAEDCLAQMDDEGLEQILLSAIESKRASLPVAVWNATWGVEEVERLLTLSKGYYPVASESNPVSDLVRDLDHLNQAVAALSAEQLEVSLEDIGRIHQRWQAEFRAGQIINSARLLIAALNAGTETIKARLDKRPLCQNERPNAQSEIVRNFFFNIYVGEVQPYMSDVSRGRDSLILALAELADQQRGVMPASFEQWYQRHLSDQADTSLWRQLDQAMMQHTRHWQELLGQCGLRPG